MHTSRNQTVNQTPLKRKVSLVEFYDILFGNFQTC